MDLLWGQWCVLGVAGHSKKAGAYCIDPEALLLATCRFGRFDPRLFDGMLEWLTRHEEFLSLLRVNTLLKKGFDESAQVMRPVAAFLEEEYKKHRWSKLVGELPGISKPEPLFFYANGLPVEIFGRQDARFLSYGLSRGRVENKGHIGPFQMNHPGSLRLRLRALMGVSSRTDVLVYLMMFKTGGHPSLIAKELDYTQRGIHQALVSMSLSGWVLRNERPREVVYTVADSLRETFISSLKQNPKWVTWSRFFQALEIFWKILEKASPDRLPVEGRSAELRGAMQKASNLLSLLGFSGYFQECQQKTGAEYIDSLAVAWGHLFALLNE